MSSNSYFSGLIGSFPLLLILKLRRFRLFLIHITVFTHQTPPLSWILGSQVFFSKNLKMNYNFWSSSSPLLIPKLRFNNGFLSIHWVSKKPQILTQILVFRDLCIDSIGIEFIFRNGFHNAWFDVITFFSWFFYMTSCYIYILYDHELSLKICMHYELRNLWIKDAFR